MSKVHILIVSSIAVLSLVAACASKTRSDASDSAAQKTTGGKVAVINTMCPIGADDYESKERPADLARTYNGKSIGFCCESCVKQFDKMSDEKKAAVLTAAAANKAL